MEPNDISGLFASESEQGVETESNIFDNTFLTSSNEQIKLQTTEREDLTTKNAVKYLLAGTLKKKVCRYCLKVASPLSELDQVLQIGGSGVLYKITLRDMVARFHPFKVANDANFPNKICNKCLNRTISSYLFTQQCERSERALRNCFEDMFHKIQRLDSLEPQKKRGRHKLHPNYNILYTEHEKVIDYAEPIINLINAGSELLHDDEKNIFNDFECLKCWQVLPNLASLINHETLHPKSMYYHCRHCGKSFTKKNLLKKHILKAHNVPKDQKTDFQCLTCGVISDDYNTHLQHIEKHKFQMVLEHLVERNMDKLCAVCLDNNQPLTDLDKTVCLHGGYPEIMGDQSLYSILGSTVPDMNILHNYTGTKICEKCLDHAITSYVFKQQTQYLRNRLNICISSMLENLNKIEIPEGNVFVEVSQNVIMPIIEPKFDETLLLKGEEIDRLTVEVLEDEFRLPSESDESDSETQKKTDIQSIDMFELNAMLAELGETLDNPAKKAVKTYEKRKLCNGVQAHNDKRYNSLNVCSEFLTFKKKKKLKNRFYSCKFTCPMCSKHFVSDYFLKKHVLKHVHKSVKCNLCNYQYNSKFYLYEHKKMCHLLKQEIYSSCNTCGRSFTHLNKLDSHIKSHMQKECHLCNKIFVSQKHYDCHMQRHAVKLRLLKPRQAHTCSFCEKEFTNDNELSVHVNKVHLQIKPYGCDMCEKQFYTESNLTSHKKVHSLFSKESCAFCGKMLKCRRDLVVHVRKHIGVQPYTCQLCGLTFYSSRKVDNHMVRFHGGRFCCKLCKTVFKNKSGLKDHVNRAHNII